MTHPLEFTYNSLTMKYIILIIITLLSAMEINAQDINKTALRQAIEQQLETYPASTLQDIYKAFYQEHFGAEHMIADTAAVRNYLNYELDHCDDLATTLYYEPIGVSGDYVRVYLNAVKDGLITPEQLLWAFLDSAKPQQHQTINWATKWETIVEVIDEIKPGFGDKGERELLHQASQQNQAVHHSSAYNAAYHPHYRIVKREIFEQQLKPAIITSKF